MELLADHLVEMIATARQSPDLNDPEAEKMAAAYTWSRVFERTLSVYGEVVKNPIKRCET